MSDTVGALLAFGLYLIFMLSIGWFFYFRTKTLSDYILGGRGLGSWVASMSAQASDMSGWLLMGLPGYAYSSGMEATWIAVGLALGTYLNWELVAGRLRRYTEAAGDSITLPEYFENRFRDTSGLLRVISAIFILIFFTLYTSSGFVAGAKLFDTVFGLPYAWALVLSVLVIILYTSLGGFFAVCWTDFFQGLMMFCAITAVPVVAVVALGGYCEAVTAIDTADSDLLNMFTTVEGKSLTGLAIISLLAWGLGYFGQPHILARFMAIRSSKLVARARVIAMVWVVISLAGAVAIGLIGVVFLDTPLKGGDEEKVFMHIINALFHPFVAGLLLSAILAAIMSTADSQLLVSSSVLAEDFYKVMLKKDASQAELVWVGRATVVAVAIIAFLLALNPESKVLDLVSYAWGGLGGTFGPIVILSLLWKRMTRNGALGGIVVGGLTIIIWKNLEGGIFEVYELAPAFLLSMIAIVVISLMDQEPPDEIKREFDSVMAAE